MFIWIFLNAVLDIVMCAGSSKSLEVYDMNVGKCVRTIADIHTRPVHCIKQHEVRIVIVLQELLIIVVYCSHFLILWDGK